MKMQQQEVLFTNDTRSFKRLKGNRILDETNIKQISIQIAQHGQATPVIVNQRKEIIDGQHRLEVCKRLGIGIYYIVKNNAGIDDVISANVVGKKWKTEDYVNLFAERDNNPNYVNLQRFISDCQKKGLTSGVAIWLAQGTMSTKNWYLNQQGELVPNQGSSSKNSDLVYQGNSIKVGKFEFSNVKSAHTRLDVLMRFQAWDFFKKSGFVGALMQVMRIKNFKVDRLLRCANKYPSKFTNEPTTEGFVEMFEKTYNKHHSNKLPLCNNPERFAITND
jgi:hypothetical protein